MPVSHCQHGLAAMAGDSLPEGKAITSSGGNTEVQRRLDALSHLSPDELRKEWRRLYRSQSPRLSRDLLVRAIAYRIQELRYGGLSKATRRQLTSLAEVRDSGAQIAKDGVQRVRAGARLIREWNGRTHTVTVEEDGFTYAGRSYQSLSAIARDITGARWSGPRFFGLTTSEARRMSKRSAVGAKKASRKLRCAIYTRKSTEEGLEQDFNSLDAQREACEAFVASQKHEGWVALPTHYDDGGYSGGTLERPALQRLLGRHPRVEGRRRRRLQDRSAHPLACSILPRSSRCSMRMASPSSR